MTNTPRKAKRRSKREKAGNALIHHHTLGIYRSFNQPNKHGKLVKDNSPAHLT